VSYKINQDPGAVRSTLAQAVENRRATGERQVDFQSGSSVSQLVPDKRFAGDIWDPQSETGITGEFGGPANTVSGPTASAVAQDKLKQFMEMFMSNSRNVADFNPPTEVAPAPFPAEEASV